MKETECTAAQQAQPNSKENIDYARIGTEAHLKAEKELHDLAVAAIPTLDECRQDLRNRWGLKNDQEYLAMIKADMENYTWKFKDMVTLTDFWFCYYMAYDYFNPSMNGT